MSDAQKRSLFQVVTENVVTKTTVYILGLLATGIGILSYFTDHDPDLQFQITSNANVLDINADVTKLDIIYDSSSLKQKKQNLRILTFKVTNAGNSDILKTSYDDRDPIGLQVKNGRIIEKPELIDTSNDYLKRNLTITSVSDHMFTLNSIILEKDEHFSFKLLVLHPIDTVPTYNSIGKIAGQRKVELIDLSSGKEKIPYLITVFGGGFWTQVLRAIAYPTAVLLLLFLLSKIGDNEIIQVQAQRKLKMERLVDRYPENYSMDHPIVKLFIKHGNENLEFLNHIINEDDLLMKEYAKSMTDYFEQDEEARKNSKFVFTERYDVFQSAIQCGLLVTGHQKITANPQLKESLDTLLKFLANEKKFEPTIA